MNRRNRVWGVLVALGALFATQASATTFNLTVNGGFGLDRGRTCIAASCLGAGGQVWLNNTNYATSGSITIDDVVDVIRGEAEVTLRGDAPRGAEVRLRLLSNGRASNETVLAID